MGMKSTKYIVFDTDLLEEMFIFGDTIQHNDVARMLGVRDKIISAGFIQVSEDKAAAYGKSISLGVESREEIDSQIANRVLGLERD